MKSTASLAILSLGLLLCASACLVPAAATPNLPNQEQQQFVQSESFAYATLQRNGEFYVLDIGGEVVPRTLSLNALYRDLGGKGRPTFANLLNQIGAGGWELVQVVDSSWVFKRKI